jgi:hypothetical protein
MAFPVQGTTPRRFTEADDSLTRIPANPGGLAGTRMGPALGTTACARPGYISAE